MTVIMSAAIIVLSIMCFCLLCLCEERKHLLDMRDEDYERIVKKLSKEQLIEERTLVEGRLMKLGKYN